MDSPTPLVLPYGRRNPARRYIRLGLAAVVIAIVAVAARTYAPKWYARLALQWDYRQCERYTMAPDRVVYDAKQAASWWSGSRGSFLMPAPPPVFPKPKFWGNVHDRQPRKLPVVFSGPLPPPEGPLLFLHTLTSSNGSKRLVMVELKAPWSATPTATAYVLDGPLDESAHHTTAAHEDSLNEFERFVPEKILAGQLDPGDSSHFTIAYETKSGRGIIDGYLQNDGSVNLDVRNGPAHAMHDAMAAVRQHPEDIDRHLKLIDLAWLRAFWKVPQAYDDFVFQNWPTRKGKLWKYLISQQWGYWRQDTRDPHQTDFGSDDPFSLLRRIATEPVSDGDGPLDRLTPQEKRLAMRLVEERRFKPNPLPSGCTPMNSEVAVPPPPLPPPKWEVATEEQLIKWAEHGSDEDKYNSLPELAVRIGKRKVEADVVSRLVDEALALQADDSQKWYWGWGEVVYAARQQGMVSDELWRQYLSSGFRLTFSCPDDATHQSGLKYTIDIGAQRLGQPHYVTRIHEEWTVSGTPADPNYGSGRRIRYAMGHTFISGGRIDDGNPLFKALKPGYQLLEMRYVIEVFNTEKEACDFENFHAAGLKVFTFRAPFRLLSNPTTGPNDPPGR